MDILSPPAPRVGTPRLTDNHRALKPGDNILLDDATARAVRAHGNYKKWKMVQRTEGGMVRLWRLS